MTKSRNVFLLALLGMTLFAANVMADGGGAANTAVVNLNGKTYSCTLQGQGAGAISPYPFPSNQLQDEKIKSCYGTCENSYKSAPNQFEAFKVCNKSCGVSAGSQSVCLGACTDSMSSSPYPDRVFKQCANTCGSSYAIDCLDRCTKPYPDSPFPDKVFKTCQAECKKPIPGGAK